MSSESFDLGSALQELNSHNSLISHPPGDNIEDSTRWPVPVEVMFHGLAGDIVRVIEPHSEADPVAILTQILTAFGNIVGRSAYYEVEADRHYPNIFIVNRISIGR